jgi:hypothetical protein
MCVVNRDLGQVTFGDRGVSQLDRRLTCHNMLLFAEWHFRSSGRLDIRRCPTSTLELLFGNSTKGVWALGSSVMILLYFDTLAKMVNQDYCHDVMFFGWAWPDSTL